MSQPTAYPPSWAPKGAPPPDPEPHNPNAVEALLVAVDAYVASLTDDELRLLLARTRNGGGQTAPAQPSAY